MKSESSLDQYNARLVALGNKLEYGLDDDETFMPGAMMTTVRTLRAFLAHENG